MMRAVQTHEEPLAGGSYVTTKLSDFDSIIAHEKAFYNLRAQLALKGHSLTRTDRADGVVSYHASRWGLVRHLGSLEEAQAFLVQIGGAQ